MQSLVKKKVLHATVRFSESAPGCQQARCASCWAGGAEQGCGEAAARLRSSRPNRKIFQSNFSDIRART